MVGIYFKTKLAHVLELFRLRRREFLTCLRNVVDEHVELPCSCNLRIKLADRASRGVPRICEGWLAFSLPRFIQGLEALGAHPYLSFDNNIDGARKRERHRLYRLDVVGHVFAYHAVAARRSSFEEPFFIIKNNLESVDLQLAYIRGMNGAIRFSAGGGS